MLTRSWASEMNNCTKKLKIRLWTCSIDSISAVLFSRRCQTSLLTHRKSPGGENTVRDYQTSWGCRNVKYKAANKRVWIGSMLQQSKWRRRFCNWEEKHVWGLSWLSDGFAYQWSDGASSKRNKMMCNTPEQNGAQFAKGALATLQWREQKKTSFLDWFWLMMRCVVVWKWSKRKNRRRWSQEDTRKRNMKQLFSARLQASLATCFAFAQDDRICIKMLPKIKEQIDFYIDCLGHFARIHMEVSMSFSCARS